VPDFVYQWDQRMRQGAGAYRNTAGRVVSNQQARVALDAYIDTSANGTRLLSESLRAGRISLADWQLSMREMIRVEHINSASAASGGYGQLTQSDFGRIGNIVKEQYKYLDNFAKEIADGTQPLDGRFLYRSQMYNEAAIGTYDRFQTADMAIAGYDEESNVLEQSAKHCNGCLTEDARGWVPIGQLVPIGSRTCLTRCRCTKLYRNSKTGDTIR